MKKKQIIIAIYTLAVVCLSSCEQEDFHSNRSEDSAELSSLLKQIDKMSNQFTCDDAAEWKYLAIGAKSCGRTTDFVAYSIKIDEDLFLKKVALYNQKKAAYNVKWKLITDCNVVQPPVILICNDGKPKFVY